MKNVPVFLLYTYCLMLDMKEQRTSTRPNSTSGVWLPASFTMWRHVYRWTTFVGGEAFVGMVVCDYHFNPTLQELNIELANDLRAERSVWLEQVASFLFLIFGKNLFPHFLILYSTIVLTTNVMAVLNYSIVYFKCTKNNDIFALIRV